jgi:hypothetical protein
VEQTWGKTNTAGIRTRIGKDGSPQYLARWRDHAGRQRSATFRTKKEAIAARESARSKVRRIAPGYHIALTACAAAERDWRGYDRHLSSARELQDAYGLVDADVAATARLAGDLAFARHRITRAREAWEFALLQWRSMTRAGERLALERLLEQHKG